MSTKAITMANALIVTRSLDTLTPIVKAVDFIFAINVGILQQYRIIVLIKVGDTNGEYPNMVCGTASTSEEA